VSEKILVEHSHIQHVDDPELVVQLVEIRHLVVLLTIEVYLAGKFLCFSLG